mmetsp:Transcript_19398/g.43228  ORF Transcript_19398/g.43228 Transcript_19398/m.43228 type:complete len:308 (+) Transcript_19398:124-1047(+)
MAQSTIRSVEMHSQRCVQSIQETIQGVGGRSGSGDVRRPLGLVVPDLLALWTHREGGEGGLLRILRVRASAAVGVAGVCARERGIAVVQPQHAAGHLVEAVGAVPACLGRGGDGQGQAATGLAPCLRQEPAGHCAYDVHQRQHHAHCGVGGVRGDQEGRREGPQLRQREAGRVPHSAQARTVEFWGGHPRGGERRFAAEARHHGHRHHGPRTKPQTQGEHGHPAEQVEDRLAGSPAPRVDHQHSQGAAYDLRGGIEEDGPVLEGAACLAVRLVQPPHVEDQAVVGGAEHQPHHPQREGHLPHTLVLQ